MRPSRWDRYQELLAKVSPPEHPLLYGPDGRPLELDSTKAQSDPVEPQEEKQDKTTPKRVPPSQRWIERQSWLSGKALFLEVVAVLGFVLTIYALRPRLQMSSPMPSDIHGNLGVKLAVTNTGWKVKDVKVQCFTNKVIYDGSYALSLDRFARLTEYSVPQVETDEPFPADCLFEWSFWTHPPDAMFLFGRGGVSGAKYLGIPLVYGADGLPAVPPGMKVPRMIESNFIGYADHEVTAIDGAFEISYAWRFTPFRQTRRIHVIGRKGDNQLIWHIAPDSEPVIPNPVGPETWTFFTKPTDESWGVELQRATPQ